LLFAGDSGAGDSGEQATARTGRQRGPGDSGAVALEQKTKKSARKPEIKNSEKSKLTKTKLTPEFGPSLVVLAGDQGAHVGECGPGWASLCPVACLVWSPPLMQPCSWENRFADLDQTKPFRPEFAFFRIFY
jgi:hypothetical protein